MTEVNKDSLTGSELTTNMSLEDLAAMFDISLEEPLIETSPNKRVWANMTQVPGIRVLKKKPWQQEHGEFIWAEPDSEDPLNVDPIIQKLRIELLTGFNSMTGFVVRFENQGSLSWYDNGTWHNYCSTVGYVNGQDQLVKGLSEVPYSTMYAWDKQTNRPSATQASPAVKQLGLVGCKNRAEYEAVGIPDVPVKMTCEACIAAGLSRVEILTKEGPIRKECTPSARMFFYVTHLALKKRSIPKGGSDVETKVVAEYSIRELYNQPGILLQIDLSARIALQGKGSYKSLEKDRSTGYSTLVRNLQYHYKKGLKTKPEFNLITIDVKKIEGSPQNYLDFSFDGVYEQEMWMNARRAWQEVEPQKEVTILDPEEFGETPVPEDAIPTKATEVTPTENARSSEAYPAPAKRQESNSSNGYAESMKSAAPLNDEDNPFS